MLTRRANKRAVALLVVMLPIVSVVGFFLSQHKHASQIAQVEVPVR